MTTISGRCLCGAVAFEIRGSLREPHACHCTLCRRQSGHFVVAAGVSWSDFVLTESRGLKWYRSSERARRGFCGECGSALFWDDESDQVSVALGNLEPPTGTLVAGHIFVDEKGDYYTIEDGLPQFAGFDQPVAPE